MAHKVDPYTDEVIEFDMEVITRKTLTGASYDKLYQYYEEYMAQLKEELGDKIEEYLHSAEFNGLCSKLEFEYRECVKDAKQEFNAELERMLANNPHASLTEAVAVAVSSVKDKPVCENADQEHGMEKAVPHPKMYHQPSLKNPYTKGEPVMSFNSQTQHPAVTDNQIAEAIAKAIRHAERVSKRDHIKADRVERVNQFLVSLRRELSYLERSSSVMLYAGDLLKKEVWHDIGVLNITWPSYGMKFSRNQAQLWLEQSKKQRASVEAARYEIEGDLEELERLTTGAFAAIEDAKRVNQESELIASQLVSLFE